MSKINLMPKSHGFTLVELLVVISIIAVLSVVGMTIYTGVQKNARDTGRKEAIDSIVKALEAYRTDTAGYIKLDPNQFTNGEIPTKDPQGYEYCMKTADSGVITDAATSDWDSNKKCTGTWAVVSSVTPKAVWKVCAKLEDTTKPIYCRTNAQ